MASFTISSGEGGGAPGHKLVACGVHSYEPSWYALTNLLIPNTILCNGGIAERH